MTRLLTLLLATLLLASGCKQAQQDHSHADGAAHDHDHGPPSEVVTVFTPKSELFAEYPALVVGQPSRFAAHLTDLRDWSPVREGRVEAVLMRPDGQQEVFAVDGPARPGIFQPVVTPREEGPAVLAFRLVSPGLTDTIRVGEVTIYPTASVARAAVAEEAEDPEAISYLKEQQWKVAFMTRPVESASLADGVTLQGTVEPRSGREVVISAPAEGQVVIGRGRQPRLGDRVKGGEVLAVVTPAAGGAEDRAALQAAVEAAEANARQARRDHDRAARLVQAQAAPARRLEEAQTALTVAEARLAAARRRLEAKTASLAGAATATAESYQLKAPFAGTIVEAGLVPGARVEAGAKLYRLVDLSTVWVAARVPEAEVNRVAKAARAEVRVAHAPAVPGTLVTLGSVLDPASRTAPALYAVPNPQGAFRLGMTAEVRALTGATPPGPVLPEGALVDDNGRPIAYVQTGGESFERRALTLGVRQGGRVQVLSGVKAGERVVTEGAYELRLSTLSDAVPAHGHAH